MPSIAEARAKAAELRRALTKLERMTGISDARSREADRMRLKRESIRDVVIPECKDREVRELLESDDVEWLQFFFKSGCSNPFWYKFTPQQLEMISAIRSAVVHGGDQAIAASRGEGKTTLVERLILKYTLQGIVNFSVLFAATGSAAENSLESIKADIAENELLREYYPEVCVPVSALENTPNRAHYQTVSGKRHDDQREYARHPSKFSWCGHEIVLPAVPGSPAAGAIIATRGLDAAVRGLKKRGKRPQLAVIDDPDTEETARSEEQAAKLEDRIDKGIGGLGGQQRGIARVMLTTLQSRISASYKFTDAKSKPSWRGKRFRYLIKPPDRADLWDEYVQLRRLNQQSGDEWARTAHQFYLDNRKDMDAGAVVANANRFDASKLPDGSQNEVSALQRYYNEVARVGAAAVATEFDNDPPEEAGPQESGITASRVQRQLSGFARGVIPPTCVKITQGIDCKKTGLHWVVRAWEPNATSYVIDYGFHESHGVRYASDDGVDVALRRAILERIEATKASEYTKPDGELLPVDLTLVDARYRMDAVYAACAEIGKGIYPVLGFGRSNGCWRSTFTQFQKRTSTEHPGDGWNMKLDGRVWVVHANADKWKAWEHDRWMTDPPHAGCLRLFGTASGERRMSFDELAHHAYARHVVAEVEVEEMYRGVLRRIWKARPGYAQNHYLDASYYADVAASILGIRLDMESTRKRQAALPPTVKPEKKPTKARPSARELASRVRR